MKNIVVLLILLILSSIAPAGEQESLAAGRNYELSGEINTKIGSYFSDKELPIIPQTFDFKLDGKAGTGDTTAAQYKIAIRAKYDLSTGTTNISLRESWVKLFLGAMDLSLGNQVVVWGSTDGFTPVNVINPKDYTLPMDAKEIPTTMVRALFTGNKYKLEAVALPFWSGDILPSAEWSTDSANLPNVKIVGTNKEENKPKPLWKNCELGFRATGYLDILDGADLSLSYYRGFNKAPTVTKKVTPAVNPGEFTAQINMDYNKYNNFGLDGSIALGQGVLFKTEMGYKTIDDTSISNPDNGKALFQGVWGIEYKIWEIRTNIEYVGDWKKGEDWKSSMVFIPSWEVDSSLSLKSPVIYNFSDNGLMVSPQATYILADGVKMETEVYIFSGSSDSKFGKWKDNSQIRAGVTYSF